MGNSAQVTENYQEASHNSMCMRWVVKKIHSSVFETLATFWRSVQSVTHRRELDNLTDWKTNFMFTKIHSPFHFPVSWRGHCKLIGPTLNVTKRLAWQYSMFDINDNIFLNEPVTVEEMWCFKQAINIISRIRLFVLLFFYVGHQFAAFYVCSRCWQEKMQ